MAEGKIKVSLVSGQDRTSTVPEALNLISDQVQIPDKPVLIKPNFVSVNNQLCATPVDAVRSTLSFLKGKGVEKFTVAVGPAIGTADEGFDNYGYRPLADEFNVTWLDLNSDDTVKVPAFDDKLNVQYLNMSRTMAESYVVSVTRTKTHNDVVVTLGLKNVLVGTLAGPDEKKKIHQGSKAINLTLAKMAQHVAPDLTVLDGTEGMQGNGPVSGDPIDSQITLASAHSIAADVIGLQAMGYRLDQVGYLRYAMELRRLTLDDIEVVGETIEDVKTDFRPHDNIASQLTWPVDGDWRPVFDAVGE
ncbi:MAG: DUF362 domain-containing protein [Chloroflexi bacterium]|nr:DUF362 domain-containing protein [Chloroflexota bacterium]MBT4073225.1 DUF362 domain-containing protein [Chloroflexota bacterium]MBT4514412.1 DUF362 domain-containing protein [Chloroflexota bacterium]MBT6681822.1 DUF362 domain-containing protein [Chloroflexota bacterium]